MGPRGDAGGEVVWWCGKRVVGRVPVSRSGEGGRRDEAGLVLTVVWVNEL